MVLSKLTLAIAVMSSWFIFNPAGSIYNDRWFPVMWQGTPAQPAISADDIAALADQFEVPAAHIDAILRVEAGRHGFLLNEEPPVRPKILFEAHWMYKLLPKDLRDSAHHEHPDLVSPHWNRALYKGGSKEWGTGCTGLPDPPPGRLPVGELGPRADHGRERQVNRGEDPGRVHRPGVQLRGVAACARHGLHRVAWSDPGTAGWGMGYACESV